jgi:hypothetical protein
VRLFDGRGLYLEIAPTGSRWWRFKYRFAGKQEKLMSLDAALNTFEAVAREWFEKHSPNWEASYPKKLLARLEANIFPWLGHRPNAAVGHPVVAEAAAIALPHPNGRNGPCWSW